MHVEQWIVVLSVLGAALFGLAAILIPIRGSVANVGR